jgi:L,D-transpeptidase YbiS
MILLQVKTSAQKLQLLEDNRLISEYLISTAKNGLGEVIDSEKTPRGLHIIRAKIGADCPLNTIFVGRRSTHEVYSAKLKEQYPSRDWILTRILWLSGLEIGKNRLGKVDTMRRYIYIHGTSDEESIGTPNSHGCIRMLNKDIIELFEKVPVGTQVNILE